MKILRKVLLMITLFASSMMAGGCYTKIALYEEPRPVVLQARDYPAPASAWYQKMKVKMYYPEPGYHTIVTLGYPSAMGIHFSYKPWASHRYWNVWHPYWYPYVNITYYDDYDPWYDPYWVDDYYCYDSWDWDRHWYGHHNHQPYVHRPVIVYESRPIFNHYHKTHKQLSSNYGRRSFVYRSNHKRQDTGRSIRRTGETQVASRKTPPTRRNRIARVGDRKRIGTTDTRHVPPGRRRPTTMVDPVGKDRDVTPGDKGKNQRSDRIHVSQGKNNRSTIKNTATLPKTTLKRSVRSSRGNTTARTNAVNQSSESGSSTQRKRAQKVSRSRGSGSSNLRHSASGSRSSRSNQLSGSSGSSGSSNRSKGSSSSGSSGSKKSSRSSKSSDSKKRGRR